VTEHMPGNPNELKEQLGIEEDEVPFDKDPLAI
jgi:26S proteasome regulatory subunit (ATPase 3-interacting protein)